MDPDQVAAQLAELIRKEKAPAFEELNRRRAEEASKSDEEWWQDHLASLRPQMPAEVFARVEKHKKEALAARQGSLQQMDPETLIQDQVGRLLPTLIELREDAGATGDVTEDEYFQASMRHSQRSVAEMQSKIAAQSHYVTDPRRQEIFRALADSVSLDMKDLASLSDPATLTEEKLAEVTDRIAGRFEDLARRIAPPPSDPSDSDEHS